MPIKIYNKPNRSPRTDRTFSGKDICRIWRGNLTNTEREEVVDCICGTRNNFEQLKAAIESINAILDLIESVLRVAVLILRFGNGLRATIAVRLIRAVLRRLGSESVKDFESFLERVAGLIPDVDDALDLYLPKAREALNEALETALGT